MNIAILGAGKMGVWFAKFFQDQGYSVVVADRKKETLANLKSALDVQTADFAEAVKGADRILIAVSIDAIEDIAKKIANYVIPGQVVMDICSIKDSPVRTMHRHIRHGLILGTHPVFGPGSTGILNKAYILTPTDEKEREFAEEYRMWLEKVGARVFIMSPKKHDKLMSVVLGLPHFVGLVACETLMEQPDYGETKEVAGTTFRMLFTLAEATALETPDLFAKLQTSLPEMGEIESEFIRKAEEWLNLVKRRDTATMVRKLEQLRTKLVETDRDYERSYETMYKMLEAAEK
jgi:prephenate dehydrogenase